MQKLLQQTTFEDLSSGEEHIMTYIAKRIITKYFKNCTKLVDLLVRFLEVVRFYRYV